MFAERVDIAAVKVDMTTSLEGVLENGHIDSAVDLELAASIACSA